MTIINVTLDSSLPHARVSVTNSKRQSVIKRVPVSSIPELFTKASVNGLKEADTGFISPSLVRECVANGQVKRLYMYPEISFTGSFEFGDELSIKEDNKYGIYIHEEAYDPEDEDEGSASYVRFPNFKLKNFGVLTVNTNNTEFSNVTHNFGIISTNIANSPTADSKVLPMLGNHFDNNVCWHGSFNRDLLKEKDTNKQATIVHAYLNSNFNNDLRIRNIVKPDIARANVEGFKEFLAEILDYGEDTIKHFVDRVIENEADWYHNILALYYFCSVLGFKFDDIYMSTEGSSSYLEVGRYF